MGLNGLPADVSSYFNIALLFIDGLIFGLAVKKGLTSAVLLIVAFALTSYVGLSIPYLSFTSITTHLFNILQSLVNHVGISLLATFPIFFIAGLGIGLWRG